LSSEDEVHHHSTFAKNRYGRFRNSHLFRWYSNEVLRRCMDAGLVRGEGFAVASASSRRDASRQRGVQSDEPLNWSDPPHKTENDSLSSTDFQWNGEAGEYRCPPDNALRSDWRAFKNERSHFTQR
jgi:hypothetical protein